MTGNGTGSDTIVNSGLTNINTNGSPFPVTLPPINQRYNVNLPVANPAGSLALAILGSDYLVDLELTALQAEGEGRVVSTPRIVATNQREARILQGTEIPYQESSSSGAHDHAVQGGRAEPDGDPADHAGRPDHHGSAHHEGRGRRGSARPPMAAQFRASTSASSRRRSS